MSEIKVGDKAVYTNQEKHDQRPAYYPAPGTVGTVISTGSITAFIQWPMGATDDDGKHYCNLSDLTPYPLQFDPDAFKRGDYLVSCSNDSDATQFFELALLHGVHLNGHERGQRVIAGGKGTYGYDHKAQSICKIWVDVEDRPAIRFSDLKFKEETMNNTEKLADLERRSREVADKIKALREQPKFTLEGFLREDFAVAFRADIDKSTFLGWLSAKTDILWSSGGKAMEWLPPRSCIGVSSGRLVQGNFHCKPTIEFKHSMLSDSPSVPSAELKTLEAELRQIADEMAALKKEMEKPEGYPKPKYRSKYFLVLADRDGARVVTSHWDNDGADDMCYKTGNCYLDEAEAQRVADMMNYFFLVQKKAREMNGLLGYATDVTHIDDAYTLGSLGGFVCYCDCIEPSQRPPMQPVLTRGCAQQLSVDPEIIASAKKAWGVK